MPAMVDIEKNNLFYYIFIDVDGFYRFIRTGLQGFRYEFVMACHEKVAGMCHAERERSIHVGQTHQLDAIKKVAGTCHAERSEASA